MKARVFTDGFKGAAKRSMELARRLDKGERIEPERTITFDSPADMMKALSTQRVALIKMARTGHYSVSGLAEMLERDTAAVRRDVIILRRAGLVRTVSETNPGHGKVTIVKPVAKRLQVQAIF